MVDPPAPGTPGPTHDPVALTDLTVITRYSLALRTATAERQELVRVLRDDLDWLTSTAPAARGSAAPDPGAR